MEATVVSIGKSVLKATLSYAKSAIAEKVALQLGVQSDKAFITDELEMMQSFLMVAHDEQDDHNKVVHTWVKQVRDVAYDVEDSLQDFALRVYGQSWWRFPLTLLERHHVAEQMRELRVKVEDVSQRNVRYRLIKGSSSTEPAATAADMFGVEEARNAAKQHQSRLDLAQLVNKEGDDLGVIGVWGTSGSVGHTSIICEAYENPIVKMNFPCRAWVRVTHPFCPKEFIQSIVKQFRAVVGVTDILLELEAEKKGHELAREYNGYVNKKRYLIVLTDLSTIEEWHQIKACFSENKLGSRIIVSTEQVEVASLSPGQDSMVSELKQLSADQTIYAFYNQSSHDATNSWKPSSSSKLPYTAENEIVEDQSNTDDDGKMMVQERLTRANTMSCVLEEFQLIGRGKEKSDIIELIREQASTEQLEVIALWGMGGLGKTTMVKDVQQRKEVSNMFGKHAFVTVLRPFKIEELLRTLAVQLDARKGGMDFASDTPKNIALMGVAELTKVLVRLSEGNSCLIVLDDLSSTTEWDLIFPCLFAMKNPSLVVLITTRREDIAKHCCKKAKCIRFLNCLEEKDAFFLLTKKVFKNRNTDLAKDYPELVEPAKMILKRCNGLPLAIVTIGGFLADQPTKTAREWRKLNEHISVELEMNPKFEAIKTVLMKSYDGLPYYLKSCFLYFSIFPEDCNIKRRRLVYRWIAEGYSLDSCVADRYFMELVERSMILPTRNSVCSIQGIDSCQLHDLIRDISIAKSVEENLVFRLEEGCRPNTQGAVRHLAISSNWEGDKCEFESTVDVSSIRSLTVFGKWKPFYMTEKMRFLRVLDLEGTKGLEGHHIKQIGKLFHLRYLSLRSCYKIRHLPKSVGNLSQLETLDIKYTSVEELPKTITKLTKLRYVHAHVRRIRGFMLPRGMKKLKTLHTLCHVDLGRGNVVVQEIKGLTSLRKLGVRGMNKENGLELCSAISSSLSRLEYLSVRSYGVDLFDCFHDMSSPPENLQCLKLCGRMSKFPGWIKGLQNLVKLKVAGGVLSWEGATMQALGNLPNLSILNWLHAFTDVQESITFPSGLFRSLVVLELGFRKGSVNFEPTSMPKLEVLRLIGCTGHFFGLESLPGIKEVLLMEVKVKEDIAKQLASNPKRPIVKLVRV